MDRRLIYAGLLIATGIGLARLLVRGPKIKPGESRVLLIGDSLAVGLAPPMRSLAAESNVEFFSLAKEGTRIDQWASGSWSAQLDAALASFAPTLVLVSLGTNDEYMMGDAVTRQAPFLEALLAKLRDAGAEVVWIGPPTLPKPTNGIVAMLVAAIPDTNYFPSSSLAIPRASDGIHSTPRGYAGWAGSIWSWMGAP
jgi:lysophospholipase L1-like esterase